MGEERNVKLVDNFIPETETLEREKRLICKGKGQDPHEPRAEAWIYVTGGRGWGDVYFLPEHTAGADEVQVGMRLTE